MLTQMRKTDGPRGFTLIELLTVVAIIGLLVGMVVPTIRAVLENKHRMEMLVRVQSLDNAATTYKMSATGNRYYPGQDAEGLGALTGNSSRYPGCTNAGSALLARCLFTDANNAFPVSAYGTLQEGKLDTTDDPISGVARSILDTDSDPMAVLYYPSRSYDKGLSKQYVIADNSEYVTTSNSALAEGSSAITIQTHVQYQGETGQSTGLIHRDGEFVITAAGTDRLYFSTSSVNNFSK